jgi:hypothetical protein
MSKEIKYLRETIIKKQVIEEVRIKDEKDPSIEIIKKIKKVAPIKLAIRRPNRKLFEAAEIFYAQKVNYYTQQGLLPISLIAKRYANDGGAISDPERKLIDQLRQDGAKLQEELFSLDPKDESEAKLAKQKELLIQITNINQQLSSIQNAYSDIYENTAEMKARSKTIDWWLFNLTYIDEDNKGYKPFFGEGDYEEKDAKYDDIEDEADAFKLEVVAFASYLINFWLSARLNLSKEELDKIDFNGAEKLYFETLTSYKPVEDTEAVAKVVEENK